MDINDYSEVRMAVLMGYLNNESLQEIHNSLLDHGVDVTEEFVDTMIQEIMDSHFRSHAEMDASPDDREDYNYGANQG